MPAPSLRIRGPSLSSRSEREELAQTSQAMDKVGTRSASPKKLNLKSRLEKEAGT